MSEQSVPSTNWSQEHDNYVKDNYRTLSAAAIAEALGRTRNAVIGRANRLGLSKPYEEVFGQGSEISPYRYSRKGKGTGNPTGPELFYRKPKPARPVKMVEPEITPLNGVGVKMWDLQPSHCRWVIGEPKDLTFCGHEHTAGSAYCDGHKRLTLQKG